ncbi:BrnT family toxin [Oxalobacteraceae bacterium OTU3REALA1]|nr:BrnT family toxin [Oxalobacteraceae bacterium OTU3REALA1]
MTTYTWDEAKRKSNLRKHGLDFADAIGVIEGKSYTEEDTRYLYGERRYITIGHFEGKAVVVVFTEDDDEVRIISFRPATRRERRGLLGQK